MLIKFKTKQLEKCAEDYILAQKKLGAKRAEIFFKRLTAIYAAKTLEDLRNAPGHYHQLTEDRKKQWACDLDQPYRLIMTPDMNTIPTDKNGAYIWNKIDGVVLLEITNYHKGK